MLDDGDHLAINMSSDLGTLLMGFIVILIGIVLIQPIANDVAANDDILTTFNESVAVTSGLGTLSDPNDRVTGITFFGNGSANTFQSEVTIGTHVNFTRLGVLTVTQNVDINSTSEGNFTLSFADGTYNVTYLYEDDLYIGDRTARALENLVPLFFAIFVLSLGVVMLVHSMRRMELFGDFKF